MSTHLTLKSFDYNLINDGTTYLAFLELESDLTSSYPADAIEADQPGSFPSLIRAQPQARDFSIRIFVQLPTLANYEQLDRWFNPAKGERFLMADDDAGVRRRLACVPTQITIPEVNQVVVLMHASTGTWEADTETYQSTTIAATGTAIALTNAGNTPAPLKIAITPTTQMNQANGLIYRRRMTVANRSEIALADAIGDGYPLDLGQDAFDTLTLSGAGKMQADEDDLRVYNSGLDVYRWLDPAGATNATTKVWINGRWGPMRKVTLAAAMASGSVPAAGTTFAVNNPEYTQGIPFDTFLVVGTETIHVQVYSPTQFIVVQRGALGTTAAAHSANDPAYVVEYPYLFVFYGWSGATTPNAPTDRQPLIDLTTSTNLVWHWTGNFLVPSGTRRSGGFLPEFTDEGGSANIRLYESGGAVLFEDALPAAGKPLFNNMSRDFPVPISAAANSVELDFTVNNNLLLNGYLTDLAGYESLLINQGPTAALTNQQFTPALVSQKLRFNGRIGCVIGNIAGSINVVAALSNVSTTRDGFVFVLDQTTTIHAFVVALSETSASSDNVQGFIYTDNSSAPGTSFSGSSIPVIPNASIGTMGAILVTLTTPMTLPAGTYWLTLARVTLTGTINFGLTDSRVHPRMYGRENSANNLSHTPYGAILSKTTPPQVDAVTLSGDKATLDNIDITLDSTTPRTTLIVMGAEENMYLVQCRIRNIRNLIQNSSFESNTTGHAATGTSTIARSVAQAHLDQPHGFFGRESLLCTYQNSTTLDDYAITLPLASQSYIQSLWVYLPSNWDGGAVQLAIANFAGSSTGTAVNADVTKLGQWQRISLPFTVAADVAGDLQVKAASTPTAGRFIYIDDWQCEPGPDVYGGGYFATDGDFGGEYLDIYFPMGLNQRLEIDCGARSIMDLELNLPVPFAMSPSNPQELLRLAPSFNVLYYTEVGVTGLTLETRFRSAWL